MLWFYVAYAKPDYLPIVAMVLLYLCYKWAIYLVKGLGNENIIKISVCQQGRPATYQTVEELKKNLDIDILKRL